MFGMSALTGQVQAVPPPGGAPRTFVGLCDHDSVHHLGLFLDRYDFAALETMSPAMQENARKIIRARNERLPVGKRMANLEGAFRVSVVLKELLKREGRHLLEMIATGGFVRGQGAVSTVMSLDLVTMRYMTLAPMITARWAHATAGLDGKLYVIGGQRTMTHCFDDNSLSSVQCLDMETEQRSEMAPMITPRYHHGAAVLGGKIYMAGGSPLNRVGTSVESFDPTTNQWTAVAPMSTGRRNHGLVSAQGKLFAVGGFNYQDDQLKSVECFDPSTRVWSNIAALSTARAFLAVAVLGDKLYAIGGEGGGLGSGPEQRGVLGPVSPEQSVDHCGPDDHTST